jgi:hypothetical protein
MEKGLEDGGNVVLLDHLLTKCFEGLVNLISRDLCLGVWVGKCQFLYAENRGGKCKLTW